MKHFKGGRCLTTLAFMLLGGLLVVFGVTVIFTQVEAGQPKASSSSTGQTATRTTTATPIRTRPSDHNSTTVDGTLPGLGVTIDAPAATSGLPDVADTAVPSGTAAYTATLVGTPTPSPTPGEVGLGTFSFPLTVTAQQARDQTRVAGRLSSINATQTEDYRESQVIFATLTAAAASRQITK